MDLKEIRKQLPHGAIRRIAQQVKVTDGTVSRIFRGDLDSPKKYEVLQAAAALLIEYKEKENQAIEAIKKAMSLK